MMRVEGPTLISFRLGEGPIAANEETLSSEGDHVLCVDWWCMRVGVCVCVGRFPSTQIVRSVIEARLGRLLTLVFSGSQPAREKRHEGKSN
jgi:hypothetical protein